MFVLFYFIRTECYNFSIPQQFHPAGEPFSFSYDWLTPTGLTTKDFIAPSSFKFGEGRYFAMGKKTGAVSFLEILTGFIRPYRVRKITGII